MAMKSTIGEWARRWVLGAAAGAVVLLALPDAAFAGQDDAPAEKAHARSAGKHVSQAKTESKPARKKKHAKKGDKAEKKGGEKLEKLPPALSGADAAPKDDFKADDQVAKQGDKEAAKEAPKKKKESAKEKKSKHGKTAKASHAKSDKKDEKSAKGEKPAEKPAKKKSASVTR